MLAAFKFANPFRALEHKVVRFGVKKTKTTEYNLRERRLVRVSGFNVIRASLVICCGFHMGS